MRSTLMGAGEARLSWRDGGLRLLEYAVAVSIALHVLAFAGLQLIDPTPESKTAPPGAISARLVELEASVLPVTQPAAVPQAPSVAVPAAPMPDRAEKPAPAAQPLGRLEVAPRPQSPLPPKPAPKATPKTKPDAVPKEKPDPASPPTAVATAKVDRAGASSVPGGAPAASAQSSAVARATPLPAPGSSAAALDEDVLARYRVQLIGAARRYKRYPRAAMDNQWEGAAEVAMVIDASGKIREMMISRSSGHEVLDQQAIDMFRKAKPLVPIPDALRGREFRVMLKAIYSLRDPGA